MSVLTITSILAFSSASIVVIAICLGHGQEPPVEPTPVEKVFDKLVAEIKRSPDWNFVDEYPQIARFSSAHNWKQDFYLIFTKSEQAIYLVLPTTAYEAEVRTLLQDIYGDSIPDTIKITVTATPSA